MHFYPQITIVLKGFPLKSWSVLENPRIFAFFLGSLGLLPGFWWADGGGARFASLELLGPRRPRRMPSQPSDQIRPASPIQDPGQENLQPESLAQKKKKTRKFQYKSRFQYEFLSKSLFFIIIPHNTWAPWKEWIQFFFGPRRKSNPKPVPKKFLEFVVDKPPAGFVDGVYGKILRIPQTR